MKKLLFMSFIAILAASLVMFGCSDDDDNITTPGSTDDPSYLTFISQFEGLDEITGENVEATFAFIEEIMASMPLKTSDWENSSKTAGYEAVNVTYHEASGYWYCTADRYDPYDSLTFNYVDSIQFKHGNTVVQWPNLDLLSEVRSYLTLTAIKNDASIGTLKQNIVITVAIPGSDVLTLNGNGSIDVTTEFTDVDMYDTTTCSIDFDYNVAFTNIIMDMNASSGEGGLPCPETGSIAYTGAAVIGCTGADSGSVSGNWNVTQTFNQGVITIVVYNGDNSWTMTDSCDYVPGGAAVDSSMVVDIINGEDAFNNIFKSLDMSISLLDSIPQAPSKVAGSLKSLSDGEDITITAINSYSYENGWHIFDFTADVVDPFYNDTVFVNGIDSIQLLMGSTPVQYPTGTESFNSITQHAHAGYTQSWNDDYGAVHHLVGVSIDSSPTDTIITIGGTANDTVSASFDTDMMSCGLDVSFNQTISSLTMSVMDNSGCPSSGSVTTAAEIGMACSGQNGDFNYNEYMTVSAVVNNDGSITVTYESSNLNFTVTETCGTQMASPNHSVWF